MIEQNEEVVEETTEEQNDESLEQEVESVIDETKFDSAGDDSVFKVDLDSPPSQTEQKEDGKSKE